MIISTPGIHLTSTRRDVRLQYGIDGVRFFTRTKTVTQRWPQQGVPAGDSFVIPTLR